MAWLASIGAAAAQGAPGAPGSAGVWNHAGKTGVGTSYEQYVDGQYRDDGPTGTISKVWFSIAQGIVTETAHGLIHEAQIKDLQFLVTGPGFFDEEKKDTLQRIEYLHVDGESRPLSLAYRLINDDRDGRYTIEKHVFTDPDRQALFLRVIFTAHDDDITPYLLVNPHVENTGPGDVGYVGGDHLGARQGQEEYVVVRSTAPFVRTSAGFEGVSDGWQDLHRDRAMDWSYPWADDGGGNVVVMAQLPTVEPRERHLGLRGRLRRFPRRRASPRPTARSPTAIGRCSTATTASAPRSAGRTISRACRPCPRCARCPATAGNCSMPARWCSRRSRTRRTPAP